MTQLTDDEKLIIMRHVADNLQHRDRVVSLAMLQHEEDGRYMIEFEAIIGTEVLDDYVAYKDRGDVLYDTTPGMGPPVLKGRVELHGFTINDIWRAALDIDNAIKTEET